MSDEPETVEDLTITREGDDRMAPRKQLEKADRERAARPRGAGVKKAEPAGRERQGERGARGVGAEKKQEGGRSIQGQKAGKGRG